MNCFDSSINSVTFYKAFISISTCMFMVIIEHIKLFKLLRTGFKNIGFNIFPQIQENLLPHLPVLSYSNITLSIFVPKFCKIVGFRELIFVVDRKALLQRFYIPSQKQRFSFK